jgi:F-type H+-transporting ATPase subunit b
MNFETFPSQWFWLVVTFGFLFLVLWRVATPRIAGAIEARRSRIEGDLAAAEDLRKDAAGALEAYETSLAAARKNALAQADETKRRVSTEIEALKTAAEAKALASSAEAEAHIATARAHAESNIRATAADAAAAIVERLVGEKVSAEEAGRVVDSVKGA